MASQAPAASDERTLEVCTPADEDEGTGGVETGGTDSRLSAGAMEDGASSPSPVGLLNLPDETLVRIYELLAAMLHKPCQYYESKSIHPLPLAPITVNRRIYRLALPVRQQILQVRRSKARTLPRALRKSPDLASRVRSLEIELHHDNVCGKFLSLFTSLVSLRLKSYLHLPKSFTDALSGLKNLRNLELKVGDLSHNLRPTEPYPDDPTFSLEQLPSLRKLMLGIECQGGPFMRNGVANVRDLSLASDGPPVRAPLPYSTLSRLYLKADKGYFRSPDVFLDSFWQATEPGKVFAVKHLVLDVDTLDLRIASESEAEEEDCYSCEQTIPDLFKILQDRTTSLERLECVGFDQLNWSKCEIRLPTVKELVLEEEPYASYNDWCRDGIASFIELCCSMTSFRLAGCSLLSAVAIEAVAAASENPLDPSLLIPHQLVADEERLAELLEELQQTEVVDSRLRTNCESTVELRFQRETAACEIAFEGEWWWS
ncbi:hypothetical protein JCM10213_005375 [Rhodosporidiobolus nylandii]